VVMYISFYDEIKPKYGDDVTVCATDTGSLLMEIKKREIGEIFKARFGNLTFEVQLSMNQYKVLILSHIL
jgi:hypothetical protein